MNSNAWYNSWCETNTQYISDRSIEDSLIKLLNDARAAGITELNISPRFGPYISTAIKSCEPWATYEKWGPYHLFVHIKNITATRNMYE